MSYRFHPHAKAELQDAVSYYDSLSHDLGDAFLREIDDCISRVLSFPTAWTPLDALRRRCRTKRFPYGLVYQVEGETVFILAVMHLHRAELLGGPLLGFALRERVVRVCRAGDPTKATSTVAVNCVGRTSVAEMDHDCGGHSSLAWSELDSVK
jgi:plasmid stabilization system protein ParE